MTRYSETTIAKFQQGTLKIHLLKLADGKGIVRYQVRINRKVMYTNIYEYQCRNMFAVYTQNAVLQIKIY